MGSTRLPGKVMKPICGMPLLEHFISRLKSIKRADNIIIATSINPQDDIIGVTSKRCGAEVFRGSEDDVLERFTFAAREFALDVIVRLTSDCPLIDPEVVDRVIEHYLDNHGDIDYVSNTLRRTYPRGLDTEVFSIEALERAFKEAGEPYEREHVTPYIYEHPGMFKVMNYESNTKLPDYRLTVDTKEDFELISRIYEELYKEGEIFLLHDVLELLGKR